MVGNHGSARRHQDALQLPDLLGYARDLGLDEGRFAEDLHSGRFSGRVAQDVNSAEEAGVAGTPSFFINEVRYRGAYDAETLTAALERAARAAAGRAELAAEAG